MPSEHSPQEQNTQKWSLHFPTTACSSLAKHRKRQKQKHVILRALTAIPCSWCTSDIRQMGEFQHSSQAHSTAWNLRPCLFKEHLNLNCSGKSHQGHATHEHRSTKSYSCNGYKTKIKEKCPYWFFPPTKG